MEDKNLNAEALMKIGSMIQKYFEVLQDYRDELKSWEPDDENEAELKRSKEDLLFTLMDEYCLLFDNILA